MPIIIKTEDNKNVTIENSNIIESFKLLKSLLDDFDIDDEIEIPLNIKEEILIKILDVYYYEENCKSQNITDQDKYNWYNNYFSITDNTMCELLESADYLEYEHLVDIGCEKIADSNRCCKSLDDVKKTLGVTKEITKDEEKELLNMYE